MDSTFLDKHKIETIYTPSLQTKESRHPLQVHSSRLEDPREGVDFHRFVENQRELLGNTFFEGGSKIMKSVLDPQFEVEIDHFFLTIRMEMTKQESIE